MSNENPFSRLPYRTSINLNDGRPGFMDDETGVFVPYGLSVPDEKLQKIEIKTKPPQYPENVLTGREAAILHASNTLNRLYDPIIIKPGHRLNPDVNSEPLEIPSSKQKISRRKAVVESICEKYGISQAELLGR